MREHATCPICRTEFFSAPAGCLHVRVEVEVPQHFMMHMFGSTVQVAVNGQAVDLRGRQRRNLAGTTWEGAWQSEGEGRDERMELGGRDRTG
jgi:hypothetical protein